MILDSSSNNWTNISIDTLILRINQYAGSQGYAVLKQRIKIFQDGVVRKIWIRYDRGEKEEKNSKSTGKRITSSRLIDCKFQAIA